MLSFPHNCISRAGEVIRSGECENDSSGMIRSCLDRRIEYVIPQRGNIPLMRNRWSANQALTDGWMYLEPGNASSRLAIIRDRDRRIKRAPEVAIDELHLLQAIISCVQHTCIALLDSIRRHAIGFAGNNCAGECGELAF